MLNIKGPMRKKCSVRFGVLENEQGFANQRREEGRGMTFSNMTEEKRSRQESMEHVEENRDNWPGI